MQGMTINLAPGAKTQQIMRGMFTESVRSLDGDLRDVNALSERLEVVWEHNNLQRFSFDHREIEMLLAGLQLLWSYKDQSIGELRKAIEEIDRTRANNAAIRAAGY